MNLNSLDIMKNILQQHSQKTYLLYIIDLLLDLLPFVQFKNAGFKPVNCYLAFKLYKWYQIAQNITQFSSKHVSDWCQKKYLH